MARNGSLFVVEALQHIPLRHALHKRNPIFLSRSWHTPLCVKVVKKCHSGFRPGQSDIVSGAMLRWGEAVPASRHNLEENFKITETRKAHDIPWSWIVRWQMIERPR